MLEHNALHEILKEAVYGTCLYVGEPSSPVKAPL